MNVWSSVATSRRSERKEGVGGGERAPILVLPLDCAGEVFSCMARCILQIRAGARVNDGNVEWKRLVLASGVVVEEYPRFHCYVHVCKRFNLPFRPLALSLGRAMCLQRQTVLCSRKGMKPVPGGALDCERDNYIPSLCRTWREGGCFLAGNHCHGTSHQLVPPRHAISGSCLRSPFSADPPSCLLARPHSTNAMAPFSRAPLNRNIALFSVVLSRFWRSRRSFFPRYAWKAREGFYWTRGTTPTHTPLTLRLVWLSSFFFSG